MVSSMAALHSLGQDDQNEIKHDILFMRHHWHWCEHHVMSMASSIAPLHSLYQDDQNEMQHQLFDHVMPLAPPLHYQLLHCIP